MDTASFSNCVVAITADPAIQDSFNSGLAFGVVVLVGALGFAFLRTLYDDGHEEL
jgi:hypothetical protein